MISTCELILKIGKIPIHSMPHISKDILKKVVHSKKFGDYLTKISSLPTNIQVSKIEILNVQMFGERVGFINLRAVTSKDGYKLPDYVFMRGSAVSILMFVNNKILTVDQYRVPVQQILTAAPAGMLDQSGDFIGTAAKQIKQQTSITVNSEQLQSLGSMYPSPGSSDEEIHMFYCDITMPEGQMKAIEQKIHGKKGETQRIKVKLIQYSPQSILQTRDSMLICLIYAFQNKIKKYQ